jgi:serine/threonine-protein kinase
MDVSTSDCPADNELAEHAAAPSGSDAIARHVHGCEACRRAVAEVRRVLPGRAAWRAAASLVGTTLGGRYELVGQLAMGAMGAVYEGRDTETGRRVAVKLLSARLALTQNARKRFRREAKAAGSVGSPHVVAVLDAGEDEATGELYLVMEHLDGEDLQRLIDRVGALPPDVALRIAAQALVGLAKAHEAGVVHRDVKPSNLFLARRGDGGITVKVLDFGLAKIAADALDPVESAGLTSTGGILGSLYYMSPEQVRSSKDVDARADLWSLGSALYCSLTGHVPFSHVKSAPELICAICESAPPPLQRLARWVPSDVAKVVHRALVIDRDRRYPSAGAMLGALRGLLPDGFTLEEEMLVGMSREALAAGDERARAGAQRSLKRASRAARAVLLLGAAAAARDSRPSVLAHAQSETPRTRVVPVIVPKDAEVEIDGARADVQDGAVKIVGDLGTVHPRRAPDRLDGKNRVQPTTPHGRGRLKHDADPMRKPE